MKKNFIICLTIVTILILIDGFLQYGNKIFLPFSTGHNPYFNRWFSAIGEYKFIQDNQTIRHNPYFNRWFSAMKRSKHDGRTRTSHNPYFNRWFSAIGENMIMPIVVYKVTILILIDGFLQWEWRESEGEKEAASQSLF